jgi:hypothetical protein
MVNTISEAFKIRRGKLSLAVLFTRMVKIMIFQIFFNLVWEKRAGAFHAAPSFGVNKLRSVTMTASTFSRLPGELSNFMLMMKYRCSV